jgi:hypothetical protein
LQQAKASAAAVWKQPLGYAVTLSNGFLIRAALSLIHGLCRDAAAALTELDQPGLCARLQLLCWIDAKPKSLLVAVLAYCTLLALHLVVVLQSGWEIGSAMTVI